MPTPPRPFVLIILDGWGYREEKDANAIAAAIKPQWDSLWENYPHVTISGSGKCVGLPDGQMGNSEVGHLNMGAGRVVHQDFTRIDHAIATGEFATNTVLTKTLSEVKQQNKALHIFGLLSPGGVHSHENQIMALVKLAAQHQLTKVYVHAFLDGRDTPPRSASASITELTRLCAKENCGTIASLIGRYYAMDRDKRWDRIQTAYDLLTTGISEYNADDALIGLQMAYERGENDEFVKPTSIHGPHQKPVRIMDGDTIIFMNFRADRARELTQAFIDDNFTGFKRGARPQLNKFVTLTEYDQTFNLPVVFAPERLTNILGDYLSRLGLHQLRIAETEKYAHVTFFFNGGEEKPNLNEDRILIPSPRVATYDLHPEMSAPELTDKLVQAIHSGIYDVIICNYANPDMVGHSGNFAATIKAIETIDACLTKVTRALSMAGGEALITSDHGNAELMFDKNTGQPHTAHTNEQVPVVYYGRPAQPAKTNGILSDIAPTLLYLMGIPIPPEMTGVPLFKLG
jgi:2,3-bisphosphoglycerate-independent phosphoglycerate mutase